MKFIQHLWLAIKIWLVAVLVNTLLGTMFITVYDKNFLDPLSLLIVGLLYGGLFTLPVFIVLFFLIDRLIAIRMSATSLFRTVTGVSIAVTVVMFVLFWQFFGALKGGFPWLLGIAMLSGLLSLTIFSKSLYIKATAFA